MSTSDDRTEATDLVLIGGALVELFESHPELWPAIHRELARRQLAAKTVTIAHVSA